MNLEIVHITLDQRSLALSLWWHWAYRSCFDTSARSENLLYACYGFSLAYSRLCVCYICLINLQNLTPAENRILIIWVHNLGQEKNTIKMQCDTDFHYKNSENVLEAPSFVYSLLSIWSINRINGYEDDVWWWILHWSQDWNHDWYWNPLKTVVCYWNIKMSVKLELSSVTSL